MAERLAAEAANPDSVLYTLPSTQSIKAVQCSVCASENIDLIHGKINGVPVLAIAIPVVVAVMALSAFLAVQPLLATGRKSELRCRLLPTVATSAKGRDWSDIKLSLPEQSTISRGAIHECLFISSERRTLAHLLSIRNWRWRWDRTLPLPRLHPSYHEGGTFPSLNNINEHLSFNRVFISHRFSPKTAERCAFQVGTSHKWREERTVIQKNAPLFLV